MAKLNEESVNALKAQFRGEVLLPGDEGYDEARAIWNGMFDKKPAIITRCVGNSDVIKAVNFARENNLLTAVKGGGHNSAGNSVCDDGIMIDLSLMRRVTVDKKKKTARIDGGALLGDADHETQLHGLAVSAGVVSHTGVGGLTLGGGFGWISRKYGLTVDNLISADVVTADGKLLTASADENPDLFWGIRGGGGNFGVVTSFEAKCAEIGTEIFSGVIAKKFEDAKQYIQFHREYVRTLPDDITFWMVVRHAPPLPFLPEEMHGKLVVLLPFACLAGEEKGRELIKPVQEATPSLGEAFGMNPWLVWQTGFDALNDHGARNYWKSHHLKDLSDSYLDKIHEFDQKFPSPECDFMIAHMEGAPSRVAEDATAFSHRKTPFAMNIHTRWREASDDEKCMQWSRDAHAATQPFAQG
ncbi:MAG TPA: FAD-binding oxidoreductase, partial [Nitrospiria bacterium]